MSCLPYLSPRRPPQQPRSALYPRCRLASPTPLLAPAPRCAALRLSFLFTPFSARAPPDASHRSCLPLSCLSFSPADACRCTCTCLQRGAGGAASTAAPLPSSRLIAQSPFHFLSPSLLMPVRRPLYHCLPAPMHKRSPPPARIFHSLAACQFLLGPAALRHKGHPLQLRRDAANRPLHEPCAAPAAPVLDAPFAIFLTTHM